MYEPCKEAPQSCITIVEAPTPTPPYVSPVTPRLEIAITFLIYLIFFGWIGGRRGAQKEFAVFLVALGGWLLLQTRVGNVVVRLANLGGKFVTFAQSGGLSANAEAGFQALQSAPDWITETNQQGFFFILWVLLVVLAYVWVSQWPWVLEWPIFGAGSAGWAVLIGIANGLLFASVFLPRLVALVAPANVDYTNLATRANLFGVLGSGFGLLFETARALWASVGEQAPLVLLILLTIFLAVAAGTLRPRPRAKSQQ